ncbi:MAG: hypothetical protein V1836_00390 [Candidatus Aenigmatarchaeota archaeon]
MPSASSRFILGENAQTPSYRDSELRLGYLTDMIFINDGFGLSLDKVTMARIPNSRKIDPDIEARITSQWKAETDKNPNAHDAPRARFEGSMFDTNTGRLLVNWSEEKYSTHNSVRNLNVGKAYQANLWTINAILLPGDKKLPIGLRNPETTDQGPIKHLTPVGFVDIVKKPVYGKGGTVVSEMYGVESIADAVSRRLHDEWDVPEGAFDQSKMKLMGIVYNSHKNFDYDAAILVPLDCYSEQLKSKQLRSANPKGKYDAVELVDMSKSSLSSLLYEFALSPDKSSGHMRGDMALTIGALHGGEEAYLDALENTLLRLAKLR